VRCFPGAAGPGHPATYFAILLVIAVTTMIGGMRGSTLQVERPVHSWPAARVPHPALIQVMQLLA